MYQRETIIVYQQPVAIQISNVFVLRHVVSLNKSTEAYPDGTIVKPFE